MAWRQLPAALALGTVLAFAARPAAGEAVSRPAAVVIDGAVSYDVVSTIDGSRLRIMVWQPPGKAPEGGFPVLYAFDGNDGFGMLSDFARSIAPAARRAGLRPPMVVAIGYPDGEDTINRRTYDLTPAAEKHVMPERPNGQPWPKLGGGDDLLAAIERDVKPLILARHAADGNAETLFGHSLGGLMVLHAFARGTGGFERFFASSPSLWVNGGEVGREVTRSLAKVSAGAVLRMTVGSEEEKLGPWDLRSDKGLEERRKWVAGNRMVSNAAELAASVSAAKPGGLDFVFETLPGLDHRAAEKLAAWRALELAAVP